jgi:quercetin dioxygenase-like cupin family protein
MLRGLSESLWRSVRCTGDGRWGIVAAVKSWDLRELELKPRLPEILFSAEDARAIALDLAAGEALLEHEVHERAWVVVIAGEVEVDAAGQQVRGGAGLVLELAPRERHEVRALSDARLLLLLTPWPGRGHPGAMTIRQKLYARRHAAKQKRDQAEESLRPQRTPT